MCIKSKKSIVIISIFFTFFLFAFSCSEKVNFPDDDKDSVVDEPKDPPKEDPEEDPKEDPEEQIKVEVGKVLPGWKEGYLDIHAINTGRGESSLLIFPDGTTMIVDVASARIGYDDPISPPPPKKPNEDAVPIEVVMNYTNHFIKDASEKLNYIMISHWHGDHMGGYSASYPMYSNFRLAGVTHLGAMIKFDKIIDRGYPNYDFPRDISNEVRMANYIKFINWAKKEYNASAEIFDVGSKDQITLQVNPSKYSNFAVRNIIGGGRAWSGQGNESRSFLPDNIKEMVTEGVEVNDNILSLGFHLKYGAFDYFSGGDLQYNGKTDNPWKDAERPVASVMNEIDVMKANHHGTNHCNGAELLSVLKPSTVIIQPWRARQPHHDTLQRMYDANGNCRVFLTNLVLTKDNELWQEVLPYKDRFNSTNGHVVVRVSPGGDRYYVYILDDTNEDYKVKNIFGPYGSKN